MKTPGNNGLEKTKIDVDQYTLELYHEPDKPPVLNEYGKDLWTLAFPEKTQSTGEPLKCILAKTEPGEQKAENSSAFFLAQQYNALARTSTISAHRLYWGDSEQIDGLILEVSYTTTAGKPGKKTIAVLSGGALQARCTGSFVNNPTARSNLRSLSKTLSRLRTLFTNLTNQVHLIRSGQEILGLVTYYNNLEKRSVYPEKAVSRLIIAQTVQVTKDRQKMVPQMMIYNELSGQHSGELFHLSVSIFQNRSNITDITLKKISEKSYQLNAVIQGKKISKNLASETSITSATARMENLQKRSAAGSKKTDITNDATGFSEFVIEYPFGFVDSTIRQIYSGKQKSSIEYSNRFSHLVYHFDRYGLASTSTMPDTNQFNTYRVWPSGVQQ